MRSHIIISLLTSLLMYSHAVYLGQQANYYKPKLERNNILNKGLWMKDKIEKSNKGDFIFRADSKDVDNLLQNNFDAFGQNYMDSIPVFSSYVERNKRSTFQKQDHRIRESIDKCKDEANCLKNVDDQPVFKSKFISQLRPASVFNDYPYEVAVLLTNSNKREIYNNENDKAVALHITEANKNEGVKENKQNGQNNTKKTDAKPKDETVTASYNKTLFTIPKRRMTQLEFDKHKTDKNTKYIDGNKINRNVFDKEEIIWQSAPIQNAVLPRPEDAVKNKPITEKGLAKVLSLLTKTFRKVMTHHTEIQEIDDKLHSLNEDFMKNIAVLDTKFQEFDSKFKQVVEINEEMQRINENLTKQKKNLENRETEMSKNLKEFEKQQKNFLSQQHQFFTIQKFMLDQNEKINFKQGLIVKTQSEISHRQNNFARILKKAKQFYIDKKYLRGPQLSPVLTKPKNLSTIKVGHSSNFTTTTPLTPVSTDSIKINLFDIPKIGPLINNDNLILNEKNDKPVDDLVYKYYFNNTFIDDLMKSKILTAVIHNDAKNTRNAKNKRNDLTSETTILFPVGKTNEYLNSHNLRRNRRWISHVNKVSKKFHAKETPINEKLRRGTTVGKTKEDKQENDPFLILAKNFCIEVGQNLHEQMLSWCVEKSLRKLKTIDMISPLKPLGHPPVKNISLKDLKSPKFKSVSSTTKIFPLITYTKDPITTSKIKPIESALITEKTPDVFFPDNDELESNLKQYELKPDPEGTVYFDGSVHTSDIVISESDALSDIMPGLDSNSRVELDPLALDLQARRRAYVRRLNENIMKNMKYK